MHDSETVRLGVVGAHLRGLPLNHQLLELGAQFAEQTVTAPEYRFYALPGTTPPKPGLVRSPLNGGSIEIEIWNLNFTSFGRFVAAVPSPLVIGNVKLASGVFVKGFLCEEYAVAGAQEITSLGSWRNFVAGT